MTARYDRDPSEPSFSSGSPRPLSDSDRRILDAVPLAISRGADLELWLDEAERSTDYGDRFAMATASGRASTSFGFFAETPIEGVRTPIMGSVQDQLYDRLKLYDARDRASEAAQEPAAEWIGQQLRELVLRYFLRVSDFRPPGWQPVDEHPPPPFYLQPLSWLSSEESREPAFGFEQAYYKLAETGETGRFEGEQRCRVVDLRQLGPVYDWVVLRASVFDLELALTPIGQNRLDGILPRAEQSFLVLTPPWVIDEQKPSTPGESACFGLSFAFLPPAEDSLLAIGPGRIETAFQSLRFHVMDDGQIRARTRFAAQRPDKLVDVSVDPVSWSLRLADLLSMGAASQVLGPVEKMWKRMPRPAGLDPVQSTLDLANALTGGIAARNLGVSKRQLHKRFLAACLAQQYNLVAGSLTAWRQIPDWLDHEALPEWVRSGRNA